MRNFRYSGTVKNVAHDPSQHARLSGRRPTSLQQLPLFLAGWPAVGKITMAGCEFVNGDRVSGFETAPGVSAAKKKFAIDRRFDFARVAPEPDAPDQVAPMSNR